MNNEQILKMVKEGTISVDEGVKLMEAMNKKDEVVQQQFEVTHNPSKIRMLRIVVDAVEDNKPVNVKVNLPVVLIQMMIKSGQNIDINGFNISERVDVDMILHAIENDVMGEIVTVDSEDAKVRIFID